VLFRSPAELAIPCCIAAMVKHGASKASAKPTVKDGAATKTANKAANNIAKDALKHQIEEVSIILKQNPEQAPLVLDMLRRGTLNTTDEHSDDKFHSSNSLLRQIPKYWLAGLMSKWCPSLTKDVLERIDAVDKKALRHMMVFATKVDFEKCSLPRAFLEKVVGSRVLEARFHEHGCRLTAEWVDSAICEDGTMDWRSCGVFGFLNDKHQVITMDSEDPMPVHFVRHIGGSTKEVPDQIIRNNFPIDENWSDMSARTYSGLVKVTYSFDELFWGEDDEIKSAFAKFKSECERASGKLPTEKSTTIAAGQIALDRSDTTIGNAKPPAKAKPLAKPPRPLALPSTPTVMAIQDDSKEQADASTVADAASTVADAASPVAVAVIDPVEL